MSPPGLLEIVNASPDAYPPLETVTPFAFGGDDKDWDEIKQTRSYTNCFIWQPDNGRILLGYKKRGFGQGMYNGFGGKVESGESFIDAARRELQEEAGIDAPLILIGTLLFHDPEHGFAHHINIYGAQEYTGTVTESEEMRPAWFSLPSGDSQLPPIPFEKMWEDDTIWFPAMLEQKLFLGRVDFRGNDMVKWWFGAEMKE